MGLWYEQGTSSLPRETFQRNLYCTHAEYTLLGSYVGVNNSGYIGGPTGPISYALGKADQPDPSIPGALEVTFSGTFTGNPNYFVMAVDYNNYVLIGGPCRLYMWILSRNSTRMDDTTYNYLVDIAISEGFEPKLIGFERDDLKYSHFLFINILRNKIYYFFSFMLDNLLNHLFQILSI